MWDCCLVVVANLALISWLLMLLPGRGLSLGQECSQYMGLVKVLVGVMLVYEEEELTEFFHCVGECQARVLGGEVG